MLNQNLYIIEIKLIDAKRKKFSLTYFNIPSQLLSTVITSPFDGPASSVSTSIYCACWGNDKAGVKKIPKNLILSRQ